MPTKSQYEQLREVYRSELLDHVLPFWMDHSIDRTYGGYISCLARDGSWNDTDKCAWMQVRELWGLSKIYNKYGKDPALLEAAKLGAEFIRDHLFAENGDVYFCVKRTGEPLTHPYNIFSEAFVAVGMAEYYRASGEEWAKKEADRLYRRFQERRKNPKGIWTKPVAGARAYAPLNMSMIEFMMYRELHGIVEETYLRGILDSHIRYFFDRHVDRENHRILERPLPDGGHDFEHMEGRLMTPGHTLETIWFLMDIVRDDEAMVRDLADMMLWVIDIGWDKQHGGIPLYMDAIGRQPEKLESNQRHWWVHAEALCAFLLAHRLTGNREHWVWFERIHKYVFEHFPDHEFGEWYAYLDRHGEPEFTVKGSKWKTLYHLPRALMECEKWLGELADKA